MFISILLGIMTSPKERKRIERKRGQTGRTSLKPVVLRRRDSQYCQETRERKTERYP